MSVSVVSAPARDARRAAVDESRHSLEMEGLTLPAEAETDSELFIAGELTADDMVARAKARVAARRG